MTRHSIPDGKATARCLAGNHQTNSLLWGGEPYRSTGWKHLPYRAISILSNCAQVGNARAVDSISYSSCGAWPVPDLSVLDASKRQAYLWLGKDNLCDSAEPRETSDSRSCTGQRPIVFHL